MTAKQFENPCFLVRYRRRGRTGKSHGILLRRTRPGFPPRRHDSKSSGFHLRQNARRRGRRVLVTSCNRNGIGAIICRLRYCKFSSAKLRVRTKGNRSRRRELEFTMDPAISPAAFGRRCAGLNPSISRPITLNDRKYLSLQ